MSRTKYFYHLLFQFFLLSAVNGALVAEETLQQGTLSSRIITIFDKIPLDATSNDVLSARAPVGSNSQSTKLFAARNSFATFNLLLSAHDVAEKSISVRLAGLSSSNGEIIRNKVNPKNDLFDYRGRSIELFFVRYLEIKGLSKLSYEAGYDERHVPSKFRRPWSGDGVGRGTWKDRPHANKEYPDILVPLELYPSFDIQSGSTQSIIGDIFVSKDTAPGVYNGDLEILQNQKTIKTYSIQLEVLPFELRDKAPASAMVYVENADISARYLGERYPQSNGQQNILNQVIDNHFKLAHRHGINLFDKNEGFAGKDTDTQPREEWIPRLSGSLFTPDFGYEGPAEGVGNDVFVIGTYGNWPGKTNPEILKKYAADWQAWFIKKSPSTEVLFYLADESTNWSEQESWARTIKASAPKLMTFSTVALPEAVDRLPSLDIAASWFNFGSTSRWDKALSMWRAKNKQLYLYNGKRPLTGSFATEDDGVALRVLAWSQVKVGVKRWFFWNGTYYKNFQGGTGDTNLFKSAHTFGGKDKPDVSLGDSGWNYSNGDGVLFYPGTDLLFPEESYGVKGPLASLRMKLWRAGIEDTKYIELAFEKNPSATKAIMQRMLPKVLWQVGVADESDPTWKKTDISWSTDVEVWEKARRDLANIIMSQ